MTPSLLFIRWAVLSAAQILQPRTQQMSVALETLCHFVEPARTTSFIRFDSDRNNVRNIRPKNGIMWNRLCPHCRTPSFSLRAISEYAQSGDDISDFVGGLLEESAEVFVSENISEPERIANSTAHFIEGKTVIGIGGNDGFVYDVNALKRNLVQESVRGCKRELLVLLGDVRKDRANYDGLAQDDRERAIGMQMRRKDRDDLIEERLSALIQANPVSTTTDSNILDGEWSLAFATNSASTILDTSRFLLRKTKRIGFTSERTKTKSKNEEAATFNVGSWRFRSGKTENLFRSMTREVCLENLCGDENAHIIDETRILGGLFQTSCRYEVFGLTRTAIDLDMIESESKLFGFRVNSNSREDFKGTKHANPLEIQVLYLDTDLCICTTGAGLDGPLQVYRKNDSWLTGGPKRKLRLIAKTASWVSALQSPLRIRQRLMNIFSKSSDTRTVKIGSGLKAVNIGELDINQDGTTKEDPAWDGPDDPFIHLSPEERMEMLKTMSLQDIYQSAMDRKEQNKRQKKRRWIGDRGHKFKRPDPLSRKSD